MLRIFMSVKIQRLRPGLNPQTWVPEASMLTTRPPKSSRIKIVFTGSQAVPARPSGARLARNKGEALVREEGSTMESALMEVCNGGEKFSVWGKFCLSRAA